MSSTRPSRGSTDTVDWDPRQWVPSAVLLGVGLIILLASSIARPGELGVLGAFGVKLFVALIGATLALPACYATAQLLGISFGLLRTAVLKLGAIFVFSVAVAQVIPGFFTLVIYFGLVALLFDIHVMEAVAFTMIMWGIQVGALMWGAVLAS